MPQDEVEFNILFRRPVYPLIIISADKLMAAFNIQELAICCINAIPTKRSSVVKAIDSTGEEFWYYPENYAISPGYAFKTWTKKNIIEMFNASTNAKELKKQYSTKSISNKRLNRIIKDICEMLRS